MHSKTHSAMLRVAAALVAAYLSAACSVERHLPVDGYLLSKVSVEADAAGAEGLENYVRQRPNSKWFSVFKTPLAVYSLFGRDTSRWINRALQRLGEAPVVYDTAQARASCQDMARAMVSRGYMDASVEVDTAVKGRKVEAIYRISPGQPHTVASYSHNVEDSGVDSLLTAAMAWEGNIRPGAQFSLTMLENERRRITSILLDSGYYKFNKDFIRFSADTLPGSRGVSLELRLLPYKAAPNAPETKHPRYTIGRIAYAQPGGKGLRRNVLERNTALEEGAYMDNSALRRTYNNFARLSAVKYTNITLTERKGTDTVDCLVTAVPAKSSTLSFLPEGTNTAGDFGAAASLTYQNRNLFRGAEVLSIEARAAFEAITGLEGYQNRDYIEYGAEAKLQFPMIISPVTAINRAGGNEATTQFSVAYNMQNRPEFHRRMFNAAWKYSWRAGKAAFRLDLPDLGYVHMPWISPTFKHDYIDSTSNRNAILRYNYEDLFIARSGFGLSYSDGATTIRANVETAGNLLSAIAAAAGAQKGEGGHRKLFNIAYAQYAKADLDYTRTLRLDGRNTLSLHAAVGIAYPYGNSSVLPFEKRYFAGGANSVRGWSVRSLGPGSFKGEDGRIDFINHTGDLKIEASAEYRTHLFWKIDGAAFVDAGNIWTLREYPEQPGGQFKIGELHRQIAAAYGIGLRFNFDYFIVRMDCGMKAIDPASPSGKEHWPIAHPDLGRDFAFHFAVGLPF